MSFRQSFPSFKLAQVAGLRVSAESEVAKVAARLPAGDGLALKKPPDLDQIAGRIREAFSSGGELDRRDLRHAAWCIWAGHRPLENDGPLLRWLLNKLQELGRRSHFRSLASAFLIYFGDITDARRIVGRVLAHWAEAIGGTWNELSQSHKIFDPARGPEQIAGAALAKRTSAPGLLAMHQIGSLPAESGFAEASFVEGLKIIRLAKKLAPLDRLEQIRLWGLKQDGSFFFVNRKEILVDSLVLPYEQEQLPKDCQKKYLEFLVGKLGDPRTKTTNWIAVSDEAKALVRKWLTGQTLGQFLDVVDHFALASQWQYRRAFWDAVYDKDLIADAWVIFDVASATYAKSVMKGSDFGRWEGNARTAACLLLSIGNGVIAEWSHNGACNIWRDRSEQGVPAFHRTKYCPPDVRKSRDGSSAISKREDGIYWHMSSESYNWQQQVANEIYSLTGVRVTERDYRLRRT